MVLAPPDLAQDTILLHLLVETAQHTLEALAFDLLDVCQKASPPFGLHPTPGAAYGRSFYPSYVRSVKEFVAG